MTPKFLISKGVLCFGLLLFGCDEEVDVFAGYTVVSASHAPIEVAVVEGDEVSVDAASVALTTLSGAEGLGTFSMSPVIVPAAYGAVDASDMERVSLWVEIGEDFVTQVDRVSLDIEMGSGELVEGIVFDQDALVPGRFFVYIRPSCADELKDEEGICAIEPSAACTVAPGGEAQTVTGRCDLFTVQVWQTGDGDSTPTPEAVDGAHGWRRVLD